MESSTIRPKGSRFAIYVILGISALVLAFLFYLIYGRGEVEEVPDWAYSLPGLNATLNSISALLVLTGIVLIKTGRKRAHGMVMVSALIASGLFLISYIVYHHYVGNVRYPEEASYRGLYFFVLISHILLSVVVVPMVFLTVWFAIIRQFQRHRRIAGWTYPVWLYVSVTGVAIYFMLKAALGEVAEQTQQQPLERPETELITPASDE